MTKRDEILADFFKNYRINDDKMRDAMVTAAGTIKGALTHEDLEGLWYSKEISWLRHGKTPKEERRKQAEVLATQRAAASEESSDG